jgi:hypothetical protein
MIESSVDIVFIQRSQIFPTARIRKSVFVFVVLRRLTAHQRITSI